MVALTSLSPSPPRSSPSPTTPRRRPPLPPLHIDTSSRRARICRAATPGADDYYSTIRSLNSRGRRVPRKSLGQVWLARPPESPSLTSGVLSRVCRFPAELHAQLPGEPEAGGCGGGGGGGRRAGDRPRHRVAHRRSARGRRYCLRRREG
jgi:hypothetical protein